MRRGQNARSLGIGHIWKLEPETVLTSNLTFFSNAAVFFSYLYPRVWVWVSECVRACVCVRGRAVSSVFCQTALELTAKKSSTLREERGSSLFLGSLIRSEPSTEPSVAVRHMYTKLGTQMILFYTNGTYDALFGKLCTRVTRLRLTKNPRVKYLLPLF